MKLSIIIPMYGVEKYIEKCLVSCINQGAARLGEDYEIICINDGSPDKSAEIARKVAYGHNGIKVIDQANQGLSGARNTGVDYSNGEFVWFVDSDDTINEHCLGNIISRLVDTIDVLCIQHVFVYEDGRPVEQKDKVSVSGIISGREHFKSGRFSTMAPMSIYRRSMLRENNLKFYPGILHEDAEFMPRVLYYAKGVSSYDDYVYYYLQRGSGSITAQYKLKSGLDALKVCNSLYAFAQNLEEEMVGAFANRISQIIFTHLYRYRYLDINDKKTMLKAYKENRHLFDFMKKANSIKCRFAGRLLSKNVKLGVSLCTVFLR